MASATLDFVDGLNVVAGASNTGKSFALLLIDFLFGASTIDRAIEEAKRYDRAVLRVRARNTGNVFEVERALRGAHEATIRELAEDGRIVRSRPAPTRHAAGDETTLSHFWLALSGFGALRVQTNAEGATRTLSFRDVAFLSVVDETRIIAERAPHQSGQYLERTAKANILRLIATGREASETPPSAQTPEASRAQREVLGQIIADLERELNGEGSPSVDPAQVDAELERIDAARKAAFVSLEAAHNAVFAVERQRQELAAKVRTTEARLVVVDGLRRRFELLDQHYNSDIDRLMAIEQAAERLNELEPRPCPVCGAPPGFHRKDPTQHHLPATVISAAMVERQKISDLRAELHGTLTELRDEGMARQQEADILGEQLRGLDEQLVEELEPRLRASSAEIQKLASSREQSLRVRALLMQRADLQRRLAAVTTTKSKRRAKKVPAERPTTADMEPFAQEVEKLLSEWNFPIKGRVVFAEDKQDLVIGGQTRAAQGKGVRAVTCAAFILGLMRHCESTGLPHPMFVALDSPLVAYKDPDGSSEQLKDAGLAEAFYRSIADRARGQVIVFENVDPPADVVARVKHHHFTGSTSGRKGFFPES